MLDVIRTLDIDYIAANPGASFRSLHESLVNYGGNKKPELLTCLHEESSVAMAHGYAKAAGKPMGVFMHGTVGLQHAAMAIYNAWVDRVPVIMFAGNGIDANKRRPGTEWNHSVQDAAAMVRLRQVGRLPGLVAALCRVHGARLQDRDDAAHGAGAADGRHRTAGRAHSRAPAQDPEAVAGG